MKLRPRVVAFRVALVALALVAATGWGMQARSAAWYQVLLFLVVLAASDLLSVTLPQGGEVSAAVGTTATVGLLFPSGTAVLMVVAAGVVAVLVRAATEPGRLPALLLAERIVALGAALAILSIGRATGLNTRTVDLASIRGLAAGLFVCAFCLLYALIDLTQLALEKGSGARGVFFSLATMIGPMYLALGALGLLAAVVYPSLGIWALTLITLLLFVVRQAFNLYAGVRSNYQETLRALSEAIEAQDPTTCGHAERTADLAVRIGREMGMHGRSLETLSYAALLHDIGKLATPEDSLDALLDAMAPSPGAERFHAERGAEILGQVEYLRSTAELVRYHHHQAEHKGRRHPALPLGSRIIGVASRFDRLTGVDAATNLDAHQALQAMRKDPTTPYDSSVLRALEKLALRGHVASGSTAGRRLAPDVE